MVVPFYNDHGYLTKMQILVDFSGKALMNVYFTLRIDQPSETTTFTGGSFRGISRYKDAVLMCVTQSYKYRIYLGYVSLYVSLILIELFLCAMQILSI